MARPIVLGPDDVRVFPDAPERFNTRRAGVPAGRLEPFEYESAVTGTRRKANVYHDSIEATTTGEPFARISGSLQT